jgi:hypothetical protein
LERFVTPAPPCVLAINVQKKLGDGKPIGTLQDDLLPDPVICRFPRFDVVIESIEQAQLLNKQRPELVECGGRAHGGVEPRKVSAGHNQLGNELASSAKTPDRIVGHACPSSI